VGLQNFFGGIKQEKGKGKMRGDPCVLNQGEGFQFGCCCGVVLMEILEKGTGRQGGGDRE